VNPFLLPSKMVKDGRLVVHPMVESTAGGFAATPRDLVRWAKALFEARALPRDATAEMTRHSVATGDGRRYGLGLYRLETPLGTRLGTRRIFSGLPVGAALYFSDSRIAVAVEMNRDFGVDVNALAARDRRARARGIRAPTHPDPARPGASNPLPHTNWRSVCSIETRSRCAAITASIDL